MTFQVDNIFETKLYFSTVENFDDIQEELLEAFDKVEFQTTHGNGWGQTHLLSDATFGENFLVKYDCVFFMEELHNHLKKYVNSYYSEKDVDFKYVINSSWMTYSKIGHYTPVHNHGGSDISGVYYLKKSSDGKDGNIYFKTPIVASCGSNLYLKERQTYNFEEGEIVLFPGFLDHGVQTNETEEDRISLSFNISIQIESLSK
jgi:uncharacterized protein (TIGR02466 family)